MNIAARMESLAAGGGICISGSVYEQVKGKMALRYEDLGTQSFKNNVWGYLTSAQNPAVARQHFEEAEKRLAEDGGTF